MQCNGEMVVLGVSASYLHRGRFLGAGEGMKLNRGLEGFENLFCTRRKEVKKHQFDGLKCEGMNIYEGLRLKKKTFALNLPSLGGLAVNLCYLSFTFFGRTFTRSLVMEESKENQQFSGLIRLGLYKLGLILVVCPTCHLVQIISKKQLREQNCPFCGDVKRKEI